MHETAVFALLGALMFCTKLLMEPLPNIHPLGLFTAVFALAYRAKGLIPLYIYVFLDGAFYGFDLWWMPYLYIWTLLWGAFMLLPKKMSLKAAAVVCPLLCGLHGLLFGVLYSPAQALLFGLGWKQLLTWIAAGLPFDALHAVGDFAFGFLIIPLWTLLARIDRCAAKPPQRAAKTQNRDKEA